MAENYLFWEMTEDIQKTAKEKISENTKRTAREILISPELIKNKNISVKIGTVENRNCPDTIYIYISFWIKPENNNTKRKLETLLENIYNIQLKNILVNNRFFPNEQENIYIRNIPENFNYNNKNNFISLELYLHTININSEKKYPLNNKKQTELFKNALKIANIIGNSSVLQGKKGFIIQKKSTASMCRN